MTQCPKCGGSGGYQKVRQARGPWVTLELWDGTVDDTNVDNLKFTEPKRVRCIDCKKLIPNPKL